jgi:hypothetical protein
MHHSRVIRITATRDYPYAAITTQQRVTTAHESSIGIFFIIEQTGREPRNFFVKIIIHIITLIRYRRVMQFRILITYLFSSALFSHTIPPIDLILPADFD